MVREGIVRRGLLAMVRDGNWKARISLVNGERGDWNSRITVFPWRERGLVERGCTGHGVTSG